MAWTSIYKNEPMASQRPKTALHFKPMANQVQPQDPPHFVLVPMMAQGHMIPMLDMARLLAAGGAAVTFVTTPANAARIAALIDRIRQTCLSITFLILPFPCSSVGLPEGCENIDALPSRELLPNFVKALPMLREPLIASLRRQRLKPSCVVNDSCHVWAREVAKEFGARRMTFNGFGCFALMVRNVIYYEKIFENEEEDQEVVVPGLPHRIEITKAQTPALVMSPWFDAMRQEMMQVESESDGVIVNSCDTLESPYKELYEKTINKKIWTIGPMSLCSTDAADVAVRGNTSSIESNHVLTWLDRMEPSSVLYISFGSLARTTVPQLVELGLGLEASNHSFIWVIKAGDKLTEVNAWLSLGFEERTKERGVIIRGWAPQVTILSHPAVGGFMTHCGWNSTLEGVVAGVPMVTWPHFAEQFLNEKLVVEVLGIGVAVGVKRPTRWGLDGGEVLVERAAVKGAVARLMDEGEEREERRKKVKELGVKAKEAMEVGGSSYENLNDLIRFSHGNVDAKKE